MFNGVVLTKHYMAWAYDNRSYITVFGDHIFRLSVAISKANWFRIVLKIYTIITILRDAQIW